MRLIQLIQRSPCSTAVKLTRTPLYPPRSNQQPYPNPHPASNGTSSSRVSTATIAAAAASVTLLYGSINVGLSDVTMSSPSSIRDPVQTSQLDAISVPSIPPSFPELSIGTSSGNNSLLDKVAQADPNAVQTLSRMLADQSSHKKLLDEKVIHALLEGLLAAKKTGSPARPTQLAILRMLADLAEHNSTDDQFSDPALPNALTSILSDVVQAFSEPWMHWIQRNVSFSSSPTPLEQATKRQTSQDLLLFDDKPASVDLDAGIAFHAMRCVANIARHTHLHETILSTPLLTLLCKLLSSIYTYNPSELSTPAASHQYTQLLCFSTMSVSALAKSAPHQVVANHAHIPIIALTIQSHDSTIQAFAAGGLRNLARHPPSDLPDRWRVHREIVVSGVANALVECMQPGTPPRCKSFAIFAFTDLMTSGHHKAHIIRQRLSSVYPHFANLLKDKNPIVFRSTSKSLSAIFNDPTVEESQRMVSEQLAGQLAEQGGLFMNTTFKQHDVDATKAIGAMCSMRSIAERMIDKGLLEYLKNGLSRAQGEYWEECTAIIGRLAEWSEFRTLITKSGIMRDVLRRPCLEKDGAQTALFLANMARDEGSRVDIAHNGLRILLTSGTSKNEEAVKHAIRALYNISLEGFSRVIASQNGSINPIIKAAKSSDVEARRLAIGALAEISEAFELATTLVEADIVNVLLKAAGEDEEVHRDVARCFAQMSQVTEVHGSLAQSGAAEWMANMISKNGGKAKDSAEVMQYSTIGICNLTYSPGVTRTKLTECGVLRTLSGISTAGISAPLVMHGAKQALANIRGTEKPSMLPTEGIPKHGKPA